MPQKIEHIFSGSNYSQRQGHSPHLRGEYLPQQALILGWVPVQSLAHNHRQHHWKGEEENLHTKWVTKQSLSDYARQD
jgi:hypothetical protein